MRSLTAIICLTTILALQYGKLASYWHCRFISLYSSTPCDCVQQLLDAHKDHDSHTPTTLKEKTEDIVLFYESVSQSPAPTVPVTYEIAYLAIIPEKYPATIFQPPRMMHHA